ncbi:MAG: hypothetical protein ABWY33_03330 [Cellulomonas sp.]
MEEPGTVASLGALAFGLVVGWFTYSVSRNRTDAPAVQDIAAVVAAVGGGAVLALFPAGTTLFGWYGIGLAVGFGLYFVLLWVLLSRNKGRGWTTEYFLDGRRPPLPTGADRAAVPGMGEPPPETPAIPR